MKCSHERFKIRTSPENCLVTDTSMLNALNALLKV